MQSPSDARRLIDRVLALAHATKGVEALVRVRSSRDGNTRFAVNELTTSGEIDKLQIALTVQLGQRAATAVTNQQDDRSLDELVSRALRMARLSPESPETMPVLGRQSYLAVKGAVETPAKHGPASRAEAAAAAIAQAQAAKLHIAGFVAQSTQSLAIGTTAGLAAYHAWTSASLSCTARTEDGTGSGWAGQASNRYAELDAAALAKVACDKAVASAHPTRLDAGRYTVILEPAAVASLLQFFINSLDARRADEGRSFFAKHRPGDKLFPEAISLRSDPSDAAVGSVPFDPEGLPFAVTRWVDRGTLTALPYSRYWAKKQDKLPSGHVNTGNGGGGGARGVVDANLGWVLDGGAAARDELIKGVQRGVLITRFWYLRPVDPASLLATGLTRDGTFLIENGQITRPVNNFRFNESPVQMLAKCDGLTASVVPAGVEVGQTRVPTLRTHDFNLASVSEAV